MFFRKSKKIKYFFTTKKSIFWLYKAKNQRFKKS